MTTNPDAETNHGAAAGPKALLRLLVNLLLHSRGTKLPPYFHLRDRLSYLFHGLEPSITKVSTRILQPVEVPAQVHQLLNENDYANLLCRRGTA